MLRTLKIAKMIAAVAAVCFIAYLAVSGLKPDEDTVAILEEPSAVSKFRTLSNLVKRIQDKESEFVTQAKKFALRINPPPPPKPPPRPGGSKKAVAKQPVKPKKPVAVAPRPTPKVKTRVKKFSLEATCRYKEKPEKSLALLNVVAEGKKWVRQGDIVGHLTIHEVKDGSIVLYQNEALNTEIFVPPIKERKSLLKPIAEDGTIAEAVEEPKKPVKQEVVTVYEAITNAPKEKTTAKSKKLSAARTSPATSRARLLKPTVTKPTVAKPAVVKPAVVKPVVVKPVAVKPAVVKPVAVKPVAAKPVAAKPVAAKPVVAKPVVAKPVEVKPPPKRVRPRIPTPEERKKSLDNSMSQIRNIMDETMKSSKKTNNTDELKAWGELLKALKEDKDSIASETSSESKEATEDESTKKPEATKKTQEASKDKKPANTQK